ncbi:MAG TPA: hypothetical protein PKG98_12455 [Myxococcota bacterium]|nr:hypothetical protein [Myxococcota bacterium]
MNAFVSYRRIVGRGILALSLVMVILSVAGCASKPTDEEIQTAAVEALKASEDIHHYTIDEVRVVDTNDDDDVFTAIIEYKVTLARGSTFWSSTGSRYLLPLGGVSAGQHTGQFRLRMKKFDSGWRSDSVERM